MPKKEMNQNETFLSTVLLTIGLSIQRKLLRKEDKQLMKAVWGVVV
jgi:hypothetical protein